ncbi:hypothetical protein SAMN02982929_04287 [Saccharopolyspora kobensis]|uniref:Uncharacterized protein n=1 Tax=Saccharopolyspora kobensis TaxID=146035 RepID=A0A1H6DE50_9PSEU|nr:hypothetical protein [Saccharopolyspora kobensis]SEG83569.1 hypothetical protein SAMN02982929_04287 [Saccharopolyspora kobensis]SFE32169.1 hypothetical protein SAMN05216506_110204 [Saccharopolyspora kobensis]
MTLRRALAWAFALVSIAALVAFAPAATAAQPRAYVQPGTYQIEFGTSSFGEVLTEPWDAAPGTPVVLLPRGEGAQVWVIARKGHGYTIQSAQTGHYLGVRVEPGHHRLAVVTPQPHTWTLDAASRAGRVHIASGQFRLDRSPLLIFPPRVDVQQARDGIGQEWQLTRIGG